VNKMQEKDRNKGSGILGVIILTLLILNTIFWTPLILIFAVLKFIMPIPVLRSFITRILTGIAILWMKYNNTGVERVIGVKIDCEMPEGLSRDKWYLLVPNHQSWIDIVILQKLFTGKIPVPKFFLKSQLIWVPVLGIAWWALDYPFMKRYSKQFIEKNPHLKGRDMEKTVKACEKYKNIPVTVINFVEGTRYTEEKAEKQNSPYKHLLKPKAGGIGYVFTAMGDYLDSILSVTIIYPENSSRKLWDFMSGRMKNFRVIIDEIEVTDDLKGNYMMDDAYRMHIQSWVNDLWEQKDKYFMKKG